MGGIKEDGLDPVIKQDMDMDLMEDIKVGAHKVTNGVLEHTAEDLEEVMVMDRKEDLDHKTVGDLVTTIGMVGEALKEGQLDQEVFLDLTVIWAMVVDLELTMEVKLLPVLLPLVLAPAPAPSELEEPMSRLIITEITTEMATVTTEGTAAMVTKAIEEMVTTRVTVIHKAMEAILKEVHRAMLGLKDMEVLREFQHLPM